MPILRVFFTPLGTKPSMSPRERPQQPPSLESEGVPDLQGALPEKEATGDGQEGVAPPGNAPGASVDWGVTAE